MELRKQVQKSLSISKTISDIEDAIQNGDLKTFQSLINNIDMDVYGLDILNSTIKNVRIENDFKKKVITSLIEKGVDVNGINKDGLTLLIILMNKVHYKNIYGQTIIDKNDTEIMFHLLENGASVNSMLRKFNEQNENSIFYNNGQINNNFNNLFTLLENISKMDDIISNKFQHLFHVINKIKGKKYKRPLDISNEIIQLMENNFNNFGITNQNMKDFFVKRYSNWQTILQNMEIEDIYQRKQFIKKQEQERKKKKVIVEYFNTFQSSLSQLQEIQDLIHLNLISFLQFH